MNRCPYCFEELSENPPLKCPHCAQYILDKIVKVDYRSANKKRCIFCGKNILSESIVCRYCHRWLDEVDRAVQDLD